MRVKTNIELQVQWQASTPPNLQNSTTEMFDSRDDCRRSAWIKKENSKPNLQLSGVAETIEHLPTTFTGVTHCVRGSNLDVGNVFFTF